MCSKALIRIRQRAKDVLAAVFLAGTMLSTLATSSPGDRAYPDGGTHYIISDCVTPTVASMIVISGGIITSPGGLSFSDFGLPAGLLGQTMTGIVGLASRECTITYGENGTNHVENRWLYSCYDNGSYKCSVYIEQR